MKAEMIPKSEHEQILQEAKKYYESHLDNLKQEFVDEFSTKDSKFKI